MNWLDEGVLFSQIGSFLSEDLGRGDITTQATLARNAHAKGRFIAREAMVVAGLEAAEAVFTTLDSQLQLEAFVSDGDEVEADKVIARTSGFADVLLAGERLALNLIQRLSGIATLTKEYVTQTIGTEAQIVDTRQTTPGLRMLEKYAVLTGGGKNHRFGLDDGVLIHENHIVLAGGVKEAVTRARSSLGHLHKIEVDVSNEKDLKEAIDCGADIIRLNDLTIEETAKFVQMAREQKPSIVTEASGRISVENARAYAETGVNLISIGALTQFARAMQLDFRIQAG